LGENGVHRRAMRQTQLNAMLAYFAKAAMRKKLRARLFK